MHEYDQWHVTSGKTERLSDGLQMVTADSNRIDRHKVERILIIYEEPEFFIGDSCIMFDKFKACKMYFDKAAVSINFNIKAYAATYRALLKANPYVDHVSDLEWEEIDYRHYDLVFCVTQREDDLLSIISRKYDNSLRDGTFHTAFFSFSRQILTGLEQ